MNGVTSSGYLNKLSISMLLIRFFIFVALVFLTGCVSTPKGSRFFEVENEPDTAALYIYRPHTVPYGRVPEIKVDDVVVAELPIESYTVIRLKPGTYTIKTDWGALENLSLSKSVALPVSGGKSYYVKFGGTFFILVTTAVIKADVQRGELTAIPSDLAACSYVAPRVSSLYSQ